MNENCQKWHEQIKTLREKHGEFLQAYADALKFAEQNPKVRETSFTRCRELFYEIKPLVFELREDFPRLTKEQKAQLSTLKDRLNHNPDIHKEILEPEGKKPDPDKVWRDVEKRLINNPKLIDSLIKMEQNEGEPDLLWYDKADDKYVFVDCAMSSPLCRAELAYDRVGQNMLEAENHTSQGNAVDLAEQMGCELLTEEEYRKLQKLKKLDYGTWTWLKTPADIRKTKRALIGNRDRRYHEVHVHPGPINSAAAFKSFRCLLKV